jgi:hypothetical protein
VLTDPDFMDAGLICYRRAQVVGDNGIATNTEVPFTFSAVVTSNSGLQLLRNPDGEVIKGAITVHTKFTLQDGAAGLTADEILWQGKRYTVEKIDPYTHFGRGFVAAICALKPLSG